MEACWGRQQQRHPNVEERLRQCGFWMFLESRAGIKIQDWLEDAIPSTSLQEGAIQYGVARVLDDSTSHPSCFAAKEDALGHGWEGFSAHYRLVSCCSGAFQDQAKIQ